MAKEDEEFNCFDYDYKEPVNWQVDEFIKNFLDLLLTYPIGERKFMPLWYYIPMLIARIILWYMMYELAIRTIENHYSFTI